MYENWMHMKNASVWKNGKMWPYMKNASVWKKGKMWPYACPKMCWNLVLPTMYNSRLSPKKPPRVQAGIGTLQCDSELEEANPSMRTEGFAPTEDPQEDFCDTMTGDGRIPFRMNCTSWIKGLAERLGGDPQKCGRELLTFAWSPHPLLLRKISKIS